ncbi:MAG TPA: CoA pyrophosphatase [Woeseiaceae bacterium]|nr:CoA pyrophosphatase [Woeseiaceae bacterium]
MTSIKKPTIALLRDRLQHTRPAASPTDVVLPPGSSHWPTAVLEHLTGTLKPAGVLIPVFDRKSGLTVLLTQRSSALRLHAGQISFPGGSMEEGDADITSTALRETYEEVGIEPDKVSVLGHLTAMPTVTGFAVTPVVGQVASKAIVHIDRSEVEFAFEVPLSYLLDKSNARATEREVNGQMIPIMEFQFERHRIWGATAHMLVKLRELLV